MEWRGPRFWEAEVKYGAWNGGFPKASHWEMPNAHAASGVVAPDALSGSLRAL